MVQRKLMIPGPVDIPEDVRSAMSVASMPHYGHDWMQLYSETQEMLKQVFVTHNDVYLLSGPGTLALEAALASPLEPGDEVLVAFNGFFAERIVSILEGHALIPVKVEAPLGQPVLPEAIEAAFAAHPNIKAVTVVHHETSTGVLNPLREIAAVARAHNALVIVDAVSSLGGVALPVDEWGIDLCATVGNKVLETPPAVGILSISPRAWEAIERRKTPRGWYTDLKTWRWYAVNWGDWHPSPVTMPTSNIYALHKSLENLLADGTEHRCAAYQAAARAVRAGLGALGFPMFVPDAAYASPLTTAFMMRPGIDAGALKTWLEQSANLMISGGLADLRGKILRVGHIGLARKRDYVVSFLLAVEEYLRLQGVAVAVGQSLIALEGLEY